MILEKIIKIKMGSNNMLKHYRDLGYDVKYNDWIEIPIEHLPRGSHQIITGICDVCGKEKKMMYRTYLYSTDNTYCCRKCSKLKMKKTMKEKYGVEYPFQLEEFRNKAKETWMKNLGVDSPIKNKDIFDKIHKTMKERYGVDNALRNNR